MFTVAEGPSQITINILSQQFIHFWCYNQLKTYIIIVGQRRCSIFLENTSMRPRLNKYRNLGFHLNISWTIKGGIWTVQLPRFVTKCEFLVTPKWTFTVNSGHSNITISKVTITHYFQVTTKWEIFSRCLLSNQSAYLSLERVWERKCGRRWTSVLMLYPWRLL